MSRVHFLSSRRYYFTYTTPSLFPAHFPIQHTFPSPREQRAFLVFLGVLRKTLIIDMIFINFLLILCGFQITHSYSTHLPVPSLPPSVLANSLPKTKLKSETNQPNKQTKHPRAESVVRPSESHSTPFRPYIFTCKRSLQSHWSGSRSLIEIPLG